MFSGRTAPGAAGNLLVSGAPVRRRQRSGYPPTSTTPRPKARPPTKRSTITASARANGFGAQYWFTDKEGERTVHMTRNGDTFAFSSGYHPTVTSPGHQEYIFTILVGLDQRSLVQNFKQEYRHLMGMFPGVQDMVDKFK
jgi:5-deoxy-glucuronate isomerase